MSPAPPDRIAPTSLPNLQAPAEPNLEAPPALPEAEPPSPGQPSAQPPAFDSPPAGVGFGASDPEPQANVAALEAAAMVTQLAKDSGDENALRAAAEVSAMLQETAKGDPTEKQAEAKETARKVATMLTGGAPEASPAEPAVAREPEEAGELRQPVTPLADEVVDAVSDHLRKYPEVEWACEASDGSDIAVVGLRVEPSFLQRVAEISDAIVGVGDSFGTPLQVVLLTQPEMMRNARKLGTVFFPGRRRTVRRD